MQDTRNHVLRVPTIIGSLNSSVIRVGKLFKVGIRQHAAAMIVAHNHPSGDPVPLPEDVLVTRRIVKAGKLLEIEVLDHVTIGRTFSASLKKRQMGFD